MPLELLTKKLTLRILPTESFPDMAVGGRSSFNLRAIKVSCLATLERKQDDENIYRGWTR